MLSADLDFTIEITKKAGKELLQRFGKKIEIKEKKDQSLVTEADYASEKVLIDAIKKNYPQDIILSEEAGLSQEFEEGKHIWVIDPLDGTSNFANNYPFFCVSVGRGIVEKNNKVALSLGVIGDPTQNSIYYAEKNNGAFLNEKKLHVTKQNNIAKAFFVTGFYYQKGEVLRQQVERFRIIAQASHAIRRDGAAALDMAYVAQGIFDGFWELGLKPWDVAAGYVLITEAGGRVENYLTPQDNFDMMKEGLVTGGDQMVNELQKLIQSVT